MKKRRRRKRKKFPIRSCLRRRREKWMESLGVTLGMLKIFNGFIFTKIS
jgi:hypothetical protein